MPDTEQQIIETAERLLLEITEAIETLSGSIDKPMETVGAELDALTKRATAMQEMAALPGTVLREATHATNERLSTLFNRVTGELDQLQGSISQAITAVSAEIASFQENARASAAELAAHMTDLIGDPLNNARQGFADGLEELVGDLKSEVTEPALEFVKTKIEDSLNEGLEEIDEFFQKAADELSGQISNALTESLEGNAKLQIATDALAPIMDQLKPMTQSVASIASSVGIG